MTTLNDPPVIAVADSAFADRELIERDFAGTAQLRWADLTSADAVRGSTAGADAVVVTLQRLSADLIAALADSVRVIGRAGVGLDTIDLDAAAERGIAVVNQPAYGAAEVASHAVALLLAVQRQLFVGDSFVRSGWQGAAPLGRLRPLDEATVGVVGCGRIGAAFVRRIRPLVDELLVFDPGVADVPAGARRLDELGALLRRSDVLSLHVPLLPETRNLIGRRELTLLPEGAIVVNVSRGGLLDEDALAELLDSGHLGGAGLDVFAEEPLPARSPLLAAPNTVLTPHCAATSERAMHRLSHWTIGDAIEYVTSGSVTNGVIVIDRPAAEPAGAGPSSAARPA